ncbi:MAG: YbhB/YbcL family Raf kinase inhibitor-like protein [Pseudolysinimonas sp.]
MSNHPNWRLPEVPTFTLESPDFAEGDTLPDWSRADGENRAPTLRWSGAPGGTKSYAVTLFDPDAPTGSGFWHFAAYDLPGSTTELVSGAPLPVPAKILKNEVGQRGYMGAAPPPGDGPHRYFFTVSALSVDHLDLADDATPAVLGFTLRGSLLGRAQLMGLQETPG